MLNSRAFQDLWLFIALATCPLIGQAQFTDDFSDGDFSNNPNWVGDVSDFQVNGNGELQLNAGVAGDSYLSSAFMQTSLDAQEWRFRLQQSFSPSGSNFGRVYLVSDQSDLTGPLNGYYLQFGESGSNDAIELFEQSGTSSTSVARGTDGAIATSFNAGIRVTRDNSGLWSLFSDMSGGSNYALEATGTSTTHNSSAYLGVHFSYTVSNATNFYLDDVYAGPMVVDMTPPDIVDVEIIDEDEITVVFNEAVDQLSAETASNYEVQPFLTATTATIQTSDPTRVDLVLTFPMANGSSYNLIVNSVEDLSGNAMPSTQFPYNYVVPDAADPRDVVINEIMADPNPVVALPDAEFIELFNASGTKNFDLASWTLSDGTGSSTLPAFTLLPDSFVLLVDAADMALFAAYNNVLAVAGLPSLNNSGDDISLSDNNNLLIDEVSYSTAWYNDAVKDDGGWTLEQINPFTPCSGIDNWTASNDLSGGTPGEQNSVLDTTPDLNAPSLISVAVTNATTLGISFDEALDAASINPAAFSITPSLGVNAATISGVNGVSITLQNPLQTGVVYTIEALTVSDCAGNIVGAPNTAQFGLPVAVQAGDVVINELLYDPLSGGSDYVELYNKSQNILDISQLYLANVVDGLVDNVSPISSSSVVMLPGSYLLVTESKSYVLGEYSDAVESAMIETDLPSYNNGNGTVVLLDNTQVELDRFNYDDDLHFALLVETEGVSLERVDPNGASSELSNWHSAAETVDYGTPGYENSQLSAGVGNGAMNIETAIFSPDNDGWQDLLTIAYSLEQQGTVGTLRIYDLAGRAVRTLLDNELLANEGVVNWDGIMDNGEKARVAPYVVLLEVFNLNGDTDVFKQTITLAHRLE